MSAAEKHVDLYSEQDTESEEPANILRLLVSQQGGSLLQTEQPTQAKVAANVHVLVRACYEQWGRWRNYSLFKIFRAFKDNRHVHFEVQMVLAKMALEIAIDGKFVYSRLMKSGYAGQCSLADLVIQQIRRALQSLPVRHLANEAYEECIAQLRYEENSPAGVLTTALQFGHDSGGFVRDGDSSHPVKKAHKEASIRHN